jgi:hypothetical protein
MTWPGFRQDAEHWLLCSTCQVCKIMKKDQAHKKYGLLPLDMTPLDHGLFGSGGSIYNKDTS